MRTPDGRIRCVNASGWAGSDVDLSALRSVHGIALPVRGADTVTVPGGVRGWEALRPHGSRLPWSRLLEAAHDTATQDTPVAQSLADHLVDPDNADLFGTSDIDRVFTSGGRRLRRGETFRQPELAQTFRVLREEGPDSFYEGALAENMVAFLRSRGSVLTIDDFAEFDSEISDPVSVAFGDLTVSTSPPNTHGFLLVRALRAVEELGITDPLGADLGTLMRIFHRGNELRSRFLADPRQTHVDVDQLINADLGSFSPTAAPVPVAPVPRGDTVGIAAADSDGYAVSLIQSVYHAFGSGLIDPATGILFHNRGTSFTLDPQSPNAIAARKRPAHTLMPAMTTQDGAVRHVLSTMGGQGQPQIIAQLLLRMLAGSSAEGALAAPRAVVGPQAGGDTIDTVSGEAHLWLSARDSLARSGFPIHHVPVHTEAMGQSNAVVIAVDGSMTAASDPRSDGSASVVNYQRHRRA
ncbi:gamma-glutamyltransferase [Mycobacterium sp. MS1601]|uniref:gamma-glutamyltransferase n=1 Tax=Mycobacterium sp. MS1601 TaxID=1936029 RepID=UPI0026842D13